MAHCGSISVKRKDTLHGTNGRSGRKQSGAPISDDDRNEDPDTDPATCSPHRPQYADHGHIQSRRHLLRRTAQQHQRQRCHRRRRLSDGDYSGTRLYARARCRQSYQPQSRGKRRGHGDALCIYRLLHRPSPRRNPERRRSFHARRLYAPARQYGHHSATCVGICVLHTACGTDHDVKSCDEQHSPL